MFIFKAKTCLIPLTARPYVFEQKGSTGTGNSDVKKLYQSSQNISMWYNIPLLRK